MNYRYLPFYLCFVALMIGACSSLIPTPEPQDPNEYLENALNWIQAHGVFGDRLNWEAVRRQALVYANNPQTTTDTYPAINYVFQRLLDDNAGLIEPGSTAPDDYIGMIFHEPHSVVLYVDPDSPAERAGVRVGDIVVSVYERSVEHQVEVHLTRNGQLTQVVLDQIAPPENAFDPDPTGRRIPSNTDWIGYVELPTNWGQPVTYPGRVHQLLRKVDRTPVCSWIIDLRRNDGGDIWSYLAALGPILGEGDVGGFLYPDNTHELWSYHDGKVFWANNERYESLVERGIYIPKRKMPPVALLTSDQTNAAGELVLVAFEGREKVRTFGEDTHGLPVLLMQTGLSDGAEMVLSGAYATDRNGNVYRGSIIPDEIIRTDWLQFGADQDPVILAALDWLNTQPECGN